MSMLFAPHPRHMLKNVERGILGFLRVTAGRNLWRGIPNFSAL